MGHEFQPSKREVLLLLFPNNSLFLMLLVDCILLQRGREGSHRGDTLEDRWEGGVSVGTRGIEIRPNTSSMLLIRDLSTLSVPSLLSSSSSNSNLGVFSSSIPSTSLDPLDLIDEHNRFLLFKIL